MSSNDIPENVKRLITQHIRAVNDLEVLLLLVASSEPLTPEAISGSMYISPESTASLLAGLVDSGLICRSDEEPYPYYYDRFNKNDSVVRELAVVYNRMRVRIIELIYQNPIDTIQSFADAFRIKKDRE